MSGGTDVAGVRGTSNGSDGVQGESNASGYSGVAGFNTVADGIGVFGMTSSSGAGAGIFGESLNSSTSWAGFFAGRVRATQFITASDRRLKSDIQNLHYGLSQVNRLRPVTYLWNDGDANQHRQVGLIAQEVQPLIPDLVDTDAKTGMLSVNYQALGPVMIKALQEQQATIRKLEARIAALEGTQTPTLSSNMGLVALGVLPLGLIAAWRKRRPRSA